ncbi:CxxH/CxxC protein [Paenibacillus contaminans]|uniref:CxxH/CxxC protein n=1 Tax=Paenibacillus contaminans TaxID=450362 RepID=A0A329MNI9_9BACL|nr:CxxH/CxxC protein [Paenibacillus contaminans]RAV19477.1 CxxH/CxxC protein [Paenibacillus contaminans]
MFVVCKEHLELAIDRFVDEYEEAPDLVDLLETRFPDWTPPACCEEQGCEQFGRFLVV